MMNHMEFLITSPAIRIKPPSKLTKTKWQIEEFNSRKLFNIPEVAVALLIYCLLPKKKEQIVEECSSFHNLESCEVIKLIDTLFQKNLLMHSSDKDRLQKTKTNSEYFDEQYPKWHEYNWGSAAEYHFFTYDYPFLDYSNNGKGWHIANQRMENYSEDDPDTNRIKMYPEEYHRIECAQFFDANIDEILKALPQETSIINLDVISLLSAFGFSKTAEAPIRWKGIPLIRRTSPSGGSRHPTEGYLLALNIEGVEAGLYHIQSYPFCLVSLKKSINLNFVKNLFPEYWLRDGNRTPSAIFILTSIFERNMFRYREPRTFRTIHMDAGHIIATIELMSDHLNLNTTVSHQFDAKETEDLIGIDGISEGAITTIGIFNFRE